MKKREIETMIKSQRDNIVPDVFNNIIANASIPYGTVQEKSKKKYKQRIFKMAAAIGMTVIVLISAIMHYNYQNAEMSTLYVDINPSLALVISRNYKVLSVTSSDEDTEITDELNLEGKSTDDAFAEIIDYAVLKGYINKDYEENAISISISNNDTKNVEILSKITKKLNEHFNKINIKCNILENFFSDETAISARELNISPGKLNLINKILSYDSTLSVQDLKEKSIRELSILLKELKINNDNNNNNEQQGNGQQGNS